MSNSKMPDNKQSFDLSERTSKFGEETIKFSKKISENSITKPVISQLVRAGTSVGANYCEADNAESRKDFIHKIGICKKESRETMHWLRMTVVASPTLRDEARTLWQEAKELNLIFNAIIISSRNKK